MESISYFKNIRVSPKKMRFMLVEIKKLKPVDCLDYLTYSPRRTAKIYYKAIKSAIENAKNTLKVSPDMLQFNVLLIEQGQALKRYQPGSRGTAMPIKKRFSHIKIVLGVAKEETKAAVEPKKKTQKVAKQADSKVKAEKKPAKRVTSKKDSVEESKE